MDEGEAQEENHQKPAKPPQWMPTLRGERALPSLENNRMCGWLEDGLVTAQPATGGGSRQSRRRLFERLEQEEQRLKKHGGRWMDIVWSLELESFILIKLTKPFIPVNFRPTSQPPVKVGPC